MSCQMILLHHWRVVIDVIGGFHAIMFFSPLNLKLIVIFIVFIGYHSVSLTGCFKAPVIMHGCFWCK